MAKKMMSSDPIGATEFNYPAPDAKSNLQSTVSFAEKHANGGDANGVEGAGNFGSTVAKVSSDSDRPIQGPGFSGGNYDGPGEGSRFNNSFG